MERANQVNTNRAAVEILRRYLESLPQDIPVREEIVSSHFWKAVRAEFIGCLLLVVFGCGILLIEQDETKQISNGTELADHTRQISSATELKVSLAFGLIIASLVQWLGPVSGGHMNPIVSMSLLVTHSISPLRTVMYCIAQCLGAIVGTGILYGLMPEGYRHYLGVTKVDSSISLTQAFGIEFMASLLVVLTVLANLDPHRKDAGCRSLSIGCAYAIATLFAVSRNSIKFIHNIIYKMRLLYDLGYIMEVDVRWGRLSQIYRILLYFSHF